MIHFVELLQAVKLGDVEAVRGFLLANGRLATHRDEFGATPLHYAALNGHRAIVQLLVERGADVNSTDSQFGATPAGWAIEYLREMGGYLGIELDDLAHAIESGDVRWVARFLVRFPALRDSTDRKGTPFRSLAQNSGNAEIARLFGTENKR